MIARNLYSLTLITFISERIREGWFARQLLEPLGLMLFDLRQLREATSGDSHQPFDQYFSACARGRFPNISRPFCNAWWADFQD
jgi:hypothetical protein